MLKMLPHHETSFLVDWCMRIQYGETSCISAILHGHRVIMKFLLSFFTEWSAAAFLLRVRWWVILVVLLSRIIQQPLIQQQARSLNALFSLNYWLRQLKCQLAWDWKTRNHEKRGMLTAQSPHSLVLWWQASHGADRQSESMVGFHPKLGSNINGILGRLIYSVIHGYIQSVYIYIYTYSILYVIHIIYINAKYIYINLH